MKCKHIENCKEHKNRFAGCETLECFEGGISSYLSTDLLALRIRNAIADKEWLTAAANHDVAKFGEWQCDWQEGIRDANRELHELWEEANTD